MKTIKALSFTLLILYLSFTFTKCIAYIIPDLDSIGKDPVILSVQPGYLVPGEIVKIKGSNFFEYPRNANKLWINNYPARIITANKDTIEFIVPTIPFGKAKFRFYTSYLGYKSKEIIFSQLLSILQH